MILRTLGGAELEDWAVFLIIFGFFAILAIIMYLINKHVRPLQVKKPEMKEEDFIQEELDRILVPVDDDVQKQMDEKASKKDSE